MEQKQSAAVDQKGDYTRTKGEKAMVSDLKGIQLQASLQSCPCLWLLQWKLENFFWGLGSSIYHSM